MIMKKNIYQIIFIAVCLMCFAWFSGCHKTKIETATTSDLNIYPYLTSNLSQFSEWAKIIDKSGYAGYYRLWFLYPVCPDK